ncbi:MAG: phosphoglycerate kinase [Candidatus Marinimicrobia bacterium]|jgi:3-phosphoglycerate kinase|nr:phosphoglycerate kinase [Candidatus Neomarinimicrobiota bacterium]MDP6789659.1 phosphoglycerate kinase [Candidatus Neomarinimicrobiota bacterium]MDP7072919.1 phosphoglycerate kinase [Candidatus Neomarinimicrobiota bacterium]
MIKSLKYFDVKNRKVLIRVDFNVPMADEKVVDDFRLRAALPTIKDCLRQGAAVVIASHLGRPKGKPDKKFSLIPVGETLADLLELPIKFSDDCISQDARDVSLGLKPGEVHLLENLRFHSGEEENDSDFSALLARHAQIYINDAFGTAHRAHASNVGVAKLTPQKGIGHLMEKELHFLKGITAKPARPFTMVLGGAKLKTKVELIKRFLSEADTLLVGGGMAFTFFKAQGKEIGKSLIDDRMIPVAKEIIGLAHRREATLILPSDIVCASSLKKGAKSSVHSSRELPKTKMGLDIGPETAERFTNEILKSKTVVWNGPMGVFEESGFEKGTLAVANAMADASEAGAVTVVGGGDSASAINDFGMHHKMSHVSTGGGASLQLLSGNPLPALEVLEV